MARNFMGGGEEPPPSGGPPGATTVSPPGEPDLGGLPSPSAPPPRSSPEAGVPGGAPAPGSSSAGSPEPAAGGAPPATSSAPAATPAKAPPAKPQPKGATLQMKVFATVTVNYPAKWKISAGPGNSYAVFTDGNASFTVYAPDPKADSAKKIAQIAMKQLTAGAVVSAQGTDKVGGYDAHWFAVKFRGKTARVVGIDGPTRIAVVETVKSGDFAKYRQVFNQMQSELSIGGR